MSYSDKLLELRVALLVEKVVNFDGKDYDVPDAVLSQIHNMFRTGEVPPEFSAREQRLFALRQEPGYAPEDEGDEKYGGGEYTRAGGITRMTGDEEYPGLSTEVDETTGEESNALESIQQMYQNSGDIGAQAVKTILNADSAREGSGGVDEPAPDDGSARVDQEKKFPLFSYTGTTYPNHPAVETIRDLNHAPKAGAVGKGELLAALLYGVKPGGGTGEEVDLTLSGGPQPGGWHVKYVAPDKVRSSTPWGESADAKKRFFDTLQAEVKAGDNALSDEQTRTLVEEVRKGGISARTLPGVLETAVGITDLAQQEKVADAMDSAMQAMAGTGGASGVIFATPTQFVFRRPDEVWFGVVQKGGRIGVANYGLGPGEDTGRFWKRVAASSAAAAERTNRFQKAWDAVANNPAQTRYDHLDPRLGPSAASVKKQVQDLVAYWLQQDPDWSGVVFPPGPDGKPLSPSKINRGDEITAAIDALKARETQTAGYRPGGMMINERLLDLRVELLVEELTRSDKKAIERMIAKQIHADRSEQKKQTQKQFETELKKVLGKDLMGGPAKINRAIQEIAKEQLKKEMKGDKLKNAMADVTKLVLRKLYRELAYSYTPVIDRIKI